MIESFGTDLECFVKDGQGNLSTAIGKIGGSKHDPLWVGDLGNLQEDNVLAEYAITPCDNVDEFNDKIVNLNAELRKKLAEGDRYVTDQSVGVYHKSEFKGIPEALEFGCDADIDAYSGVERELDLDEAILSTLANYPVAAFSASEFCSPHVTSRCSPRDLTYRTAGGHIHYGLDIPSYDLDTKIELVKILDIYIGGPLFDVENLIPSGFPLGNYRYNLYGPMGVFRDKPYGIEYRTPSNLWSLTEYGRRFVVEQAKFAIKMAYEYGGYDNIMERTGGDFRSYDGLTFSQFRECINGHG